MRIDWFTFVAQALNFLLLVVLLKRFLYRPVLDAIHRREEDVRGRLEEARRTKAAAEDEARRLDESRAELEGKKAELIRAAEAEAEEHKQKLVGELREEVEAIREEWRESLRLERQTFLDELRRRTGDQMYATMRRILADLADGDLEDRVIHVFLGRLDDLTAEERAEFQSAVEESEGPVWVRSAFPLPGRRRKEIESVVRQWTNGETDVELVFHEDPEMALGIEVRAGDRKIGWSVGSYLDALQSAAAAHVDTEAR